MSFIKLLKGSQKQQNKKMSKAKLISMLIAFVVVGSSSVLLRAFYGYTSSDSTIIATVEELVSPSDANNTGSKEKQIKTDKGILVDSPMPLRGKYDTPYYNSLKVGQTYEFKVSGKHIIGTEIYPQILSVKDVNGSEIDTATENVPAATTEAPKAVHTYKTSKADQQTAENFYNSANQFYSEGNYEKAVEYYQKALEYLPDNANIKNNLQAAQEKLASK